VSTVTVAARPSAPDAGDRTERRGRLLGILMPALVAYVPLLLTQPGQVGADTKTYLYLDPGRLLSRAPYLWDEHIGAGTITHQNIGYLWPMGPWYWVFDTLGFPDWVAQRLWLGTVMFAAALGVRYLLRTLGWADGRAGYGVLVASLAYMCSPYVLDYAARISVILLPWAGLPWLVGLTVRSLRDGGWRHPALFALAVLTVGGINATALVMVAPAVALWVVHAIWIEREVTSREGFATLARMGVLTLATSLWWMAGLWAQGRHGLPVLRFTETYKTVAEASNPPEILRGLGYWYFYGRDKLGPWIEPSVQYTNRSWVLALSYLVPVLALGGAAIARWRHRSYFLVTGAVGALLAIAAYPWHPTSPLGAVFKEATRTDAGLALRSTPRAVPLVALALAVFLGAGVRALADHLARRRSERVSERWAMAAPAGMAAMASILVVANLSPLWNGTMIAENLKRDEHLPAYWQEAADWLDGRDAQAGGWSTRVLEVPGIDFASYRWGNTVDPVTPGLMDRPYLARELFQYGSPASAALLIALDRPFHEDVIDPDAVAPVARLLSVGDIVHRADLQFERFRTARPVILEERLTSVTGLGDPVGFGRPEPNVAGPEQPLIDEIALAIDDDWGDPHPVTVYPVEDPLEVLRLRTTRHPLVIDGDPAGLVDAAGAGLVHADHPVFYAASHHDDPDRLAALAGRGADLLVTDTNRRQARRWGTIQQNTGYTERADEAPRRFDPTDQRLEVFEGAPVTAYTTSEQRGPVLVTASDYGNPVTYIPDDRPANAVDGDVTTAWRVGAFSDVTGEWLRLDFAEPVTGDRLTLVQPVVGIVNRHITEVDLRFDDGEPVPAVLDETSRELPGQTVTFPERTFSSLVVEIRDTDVGSQRRYDGWSGVGLAEVAVGTDDLEGGPSQTELIHPPSLLLDTLGDASVDHRLGLLFTRLRANPQEKVRADEEPWLARAIRLPHERSFGLTATARLSAHVPDDRIDDLIGLPGPDDGGVRATSSARLPGAVHHRASAAVDGDPSTVWRAPFEEQVGHFLEFTLPERTTLDHLDITVVTDGRHSVPTAAFLQADGDDEQVRLLLLGDMEDAEEPGSTTTVRTEFDELTGRTFRLAIDAVRENETLDWHSGFDIVLPMGIAEVDLGGFTVEEPPERFDSGCRDDLLTIGGQPVPLRVTGTTAAALGRQELDVALCDDLSEVNLSAGEHVLRSTPGRRSGLDIDSVVLTSDAGGGALAPSAWQRPTGPAPGELTVSDRGPVSATVQVTELEEPAWLVLGQSHSTGWEARVEGGGDLGEPVVIDGYANGWLLDPDDVGAGPLVVRLEWTPQRVVWVGLGLSLLGVLACVVIVAGSWLRRHRPAGARAAGAVEPPEGPPTLHRPFSDLQQPVPWSRAVPACLLVGALAFLVSPPPWLPAVGVAAVALITLRWPRGRRLPAVLAFGGLGVVGAYYVIHQMRWRHPPDFGWPQEFATVSGLGLAVVLLLLLDGALGACRTWRSHRHGVPSGTTGTDP
jgi:arabinofuranan 3-O-arabinosyltransferase